MLIDGKEVLSDPKQAMQVQKRLNDLENMYHDAKSGVNPKDSLKDDNATGLDQNYNMFFDDTLFGNDDDLTNRNIRYDTYSEMDSMEFIHRGLELIADDGSQFNNDGDVIKPYSDDESIKEKLYHLFINKIDLNNELWSIIYETIKKGDNFYELVPDDYKNPKEIKRMRYLKPNNIERVEINGKLSHFVYRPDIADQMNNPVKRYSQKDKEDELKEYKLFPWQIVHFKIEDKESSPYGGSLLKSGVRTYRRLIMLEDIMLVYRISRAPERRVFYIDVGNLNPVEAKRFLSKMKDSYRSQSFIDENGNINKKANVMSITSDIFIPTREGSQGTRIEPLQGGQSMGASGSDDPLLSYFRNKILRTMNIPAQYLGEESDRSRTLSQMDSKFGRFIERVQSQVVKGLIKIAAIELFFQGYKKEDLENFKLELTPPSNVKEITDIDLFNQKMSLVSTIQQLGLFTNKWILKNILKFSNKEVADLEMEKALEAQQQQGQEGGGDMGGGMPGGDMGGGMPGEMDMGGGMPPEGGPDMGMEGGEEQPPVPEEGGEGAEELAASTIVNVLGKDFLLENKKDFFKMMKYIKDEETRKTPELFESVLRSIENQKKNKDNYKNNIYGLFALNELRGLNFKDREINLFEKKVETITNMGVVTKKEYIAETSYPCKKQYLGS